MKPKNAPLLSEIQPWLAALRAKGLSSRTVVNYEQSFAAVTKFWSQTGGPQRAREIRLTDLEGWVSELRRRNYAPTGLDSTVRPLTLFLHWLETRGEVFQNPAQRLVLRNPPRRMVPVHSEQDIARLLESVIGDSAQVLRDRALLETAYSTGMRLSELSRLQLDDLNLGERTVRVTGKGAKERLLPLTRSAVRALRDYLSNGRPKLCRGSSESALWLARAPDRNGKVRLGRKGINLMIWKRGKAIGLMMSVHALRRAFATHLLRRGLGVNELRVLLGHAGFQHIRHYVRYAAVDLKRAHQRSKLSR